MKIAIITDDGKNVSQHFGRAPYYQVVTIENGQVVAQELREKLGHNHFSDQEGHHDHDHHSELHGFDPASHNRHLGMTQAILDCQALICGGMGRGAYESARQVNIQPIVTTLGTVQEVVDAYLAGTLVDHVERLH